MNRFLRIAIVSFLFVQVAQAETLKGVLDIDQHSNVRIKTISVKSSFPCEVTRTGKDILISYTGEGESYALNGLVDGKRVVMAQTKKLGNSVTTFHYVGTLTSPSTIEGMGTVMRDGVVGDSYFTFTIRMKDNSQQ